MPDQPNFASAGPAAVVVKPETKRNVAENDPIVCFLVRGYMLLCKTRNQVSFKIPILPFDNCMTCNTSTKTLEHESCPYIAHYNNITIVEDVFHIQLSSNVSMLNKFMCGPLNREGTLCGKCKDG